MVRTMYDFINDVYNIYDKKPDTQNTIRIIPQEGIKYYKTNVVYYDKQDNKINYKINLAGANKDLLSVFVIKNNNMIVIDLPDKNKNTKSYRLEFNISDKYDLSSIQSEFKDGILSITLFNKEHDDNITKVEIK